MLWPEQGNERREMNIALFAARNVGLQVAKFLGEKKEPLACLVLDSNESDQYNSLIMESFNGNSPNIFYSNCLYDENIIAAFREMELDLIILAWWPYIIKKPLIQIPRLGCLNFHPSYLPYNRGKNYNFWTLVEEVPFGVTLHFIDEGVDTGNIAFQRRIEKSWEDTGETLYHKAQETIVQLFKDNFSRIKNGDIPKIPQDLSEGSFHKAKELDPASQIDLDKKYTAKELLNLLRARTFRPYPAAWFVDDGKKYEVRIDIEESRES